MRRSGTQGLSLVELLVAALLLVVVLAIVGTYFGRQASLSHRTQSQSQVQDTARSVMQLVTNDLLSAGANQYLPNGASVVTPVTLTGAIPTGVDGGATDAVSLEYVTSLRTSLASACRHVEYRVISGVLQRSDVACGSTANFFDLAGGVLAFDLQYSCSNSMTAATPGACPSNTYVRQAKVALMLRSTNHVTGGNGATSYTGAAPDYPTGASGAGTVTCPGGYTCILLEQNVQTPSLKQYAPGG